MSGRRAAGTIRSLVNARGLLLDCTRLLHESMSVPVLSDTMIWREKEKFRIRTTSEVYWVS